MSSFSKSSLVLLSISLLYLGSYVVARQVLQQQQQQQPTPTTLNTTLCSWDNVNGYCKANDQVKLYLYTNAFEEQQAAGAAQCLVQDNAIDCNAQAGCVYEENIDVNYNYIVDGPDRSFCILSIDDFQNIFDISKLDSFQEMQNANKNCFVQDSFYYIVLDCQSRDVCTGICGEQDYYLQDTCAVDPLALPSTQLSDFLDTSQQLADAIVNQDLAALRALIVKDISPDSSLYCTQVLPQSLPCTLGLITGADNPDCQLLEDPAKLYWPSEFYWNLFEDSQKCQENTISTCEEEVVSVDWNP